MTPFTADLVRVVNRDLRCFIREVEAFPDDLALWRTAPGIANSAGNLALHVTGNLRHLVGRVLGGSEYLRQRDQEFAQREGSRAAVAEGLEAARRDVERTLAGLTEADLERPFPQPLAGLQPPTGRVLMHLALHLAFHLGQAGYLRRTLTGEAGATGGMDIRDLAD